LPPLAVSSLALLRKVGARAARDRGSPFAGRRMLASALIRSSAVATESEHPHLRRRSTTASVRGEAPYASHALYTQPGVLDDSIPVERETGIEAGLEWGAKADATVVYVDRGPRAA